MGHMSNLLSNLVHFYEIAIRLGQNILACEIIVATEAYINIQVSEKDLILMACNPPVTMAPTYHLGKYKITSSIVR